MFSLPNLLTISRFFITPFIVYFLLNKTTLENTILRLLLVLFLFILAALTDLYDGYLAREKKKISKLGTFLDPLADKFLVLSTFISLLFVKEIYLPAIFVMLICFREMVITSVRCVALIKKKTMKTEFHGKIKTTFQFISLGVTWLYLFTYTIITHLKPFKNYLLSKHLSTTDFHPNLLIEINERLQVTSKWVFLILKWIPSFFLIISCAITLYSGYQYILINQKMFIKK